MLRFELRQGNRAAYEPVSYLRAGRELNAEVRRDGARAIDTRRLPAGSAQSNFSRHRPRTTTETPHGVVPLNQEARAPPRRYSATEKGLVLAESRSRPNRSGV